MTRSARRRSPHRIFTACARQRYLARRVSLSARQHYLISCFQSNSAIGSKWRHCHTARQPFGRATASALTPRMRAYVALASRVFDFARARRRLRFRPHRAAHPQYIIRFLSGIIALIIALQIPSRRNVALPVSYFKLREAPSQAAKDDWRASRQASLSISKAFCLIHYELCWQQPNWPVIADKMLHAVIALASRLTKVSMKSFPRRERRPILRDNARRMPASRNSRRSLMVNDYFGIENDGERLPSFRRALFDIDIDAIRDVAAPASRCVGIS